MPGWGRAGLPLAWPSWVAGLRIGLGLSVLAAAGQLGWQCRLLGFWPGGWLVGLAGLPVRRRFCEGQLGWIWPRLAG